MGILDNINIFGSKKPEENIKTVLDGAVIDQDNSEFINSENTDTEVETAVISQDELNKIEEERKKAAEKLRKEIQNQDLSDLKIEE